MTISTEKKKNPKWIFLWFFVRDENLEMTECHKEARMGNGCSNTLQFRIAAQSHMKKHTVGYFCVSLRFHAQNIPGLTFIQKIKK